MLEEQNTSVTPFLNGKMLNVNVSGARGGTIIIYHGDRGLIIHKEGSRSSERKMKIRENGSEIFRNLGSINTSNKFCLGTRRSNGRLDFGLIRDGSATVTKGKAGDRSAVG